MTAEASPNPTADNGSRSVRCLTIPVVGARLLVPYTAVAEVGAYVKQIPIPNAPQWLLGQMPWRGTNVPLVSLERLLGPPSDPANRPDRVVVFNTLNGDPRIPFIAVPVSGLPRLLLASADGIEAQPAQTDHETLVLRRVRHGVDTFIIPDLDRLEAMLLRFGIPSFSGSATLS